MPRQSKRKSTAMMTWTYGTFSTEIENGPVGVA
jgi:hypothetical protein